MRAAHLQAQWQDAGGAGKGTPRAAGDGDVEPDGCVAAGAGSCPAACRKPGPWAAPGPYCHGVGVLRTPPRAANVPWGALLCPLGCSAPSPGVPCPVQPSPCTSHVVQSGGKQQQLGLVWRARAPERLGTEAFGTSSTSSAGGRRGEKRQATKRALFPRAFSKVL